ncbi:MAG TPA: methionine synthase [Methanoregulaceae archaeon]|nr:methionine synthase [Methanoregulaceae archaeon]
MTLPPVLLPTTVVGSYPPVEGRGLRSLLDRHRTALETAVDDQIRAGVEIISDGQVRADMIAAFAERLPGVREGRVIGRIEPPDRPITVDDTRYARSKAPFVKGILTGPTTLAHALHIETRIYRDRSDLAFDLARVLAGEARALVDADICMLQVDEPILSTGSADLAIAGEAIGTVVSGLPVPVALHACGPIAGMIDDLLRFPVQILDLEFAGHPSNLDLLATRELKEKQIGLGVIVSSSDDVETVETVRARVERGVETFGPERLLIDPDCGLRMRSRRSACAKLKNMVRAVREVRAEL